MWSSHEARQTIAYYSQSRLRHAAAMGGTDRHLSVEASFTASSASHAGQNIVDHDCG